MKKLAEVKTLITSSIAENKVKRSKSEKRTLPQAKKNVKRVRFIVWGLFVCVCLTGSLGLLRAQNALNKSKDALAIVQDEKQNPNKGYTAYQSQKLTNFGNEVVKAYVPLSAKTDERTQQMAHLETMYAKNVPVPQVGDFNGHRDLRSFELFNTVHEANKAVLQYKVSYTNVIVGEQPKEQPSDDEKKEDEKKEEAKPAQEQKTDKEALLNIPVKAVDNGYIVIENPYFSAIPKLTGKKVNGVSNPYTDDKMAQVGKSDKIQNWLTENFFPKYANEDKTEMLYMMEEPQALNGLQEFVQIQSIKVYPTKQKNKYIAKVVATFKEKEIDVMQDQTFTFTLRDSDNKFFVEKMNHTLGGK